MSFSQSATAYTHTSLLTVRGLSKYHCNVNKAVSVLFLKTKIKHLVSVQFKVQVPTLFTKPVYVGGATWLKVKVRGQLHCLWGKQLKIKGTKWKNWINE